MEPPGILLPAGEGNYLRIERFSGGVLLLLLSRLPRLWRVSDRKAEGHCSTDWKWDMICAMGAVTEIQGRLRGCDVGSGSTCASLLCMHACFHSILYL